MGKERVDRATEIKNQINKTFAAVLDANAVLQVLADDDTKCQLNQEVEDLREAIKVMGALDDKLVWLDEFNKNIIDYDKICTELEGIENTDEAKAFVKRMTDVATTLAALIKEADGEAAKYGQDIVLLAAFTNAQKSFEGWIDGAEKKIVEGYPSPNNMEEATTMVNNCKEWMDATTATGAALEVGKANSDKMTLHADQDSLYTARTGQRNWLSSLGCGPSRQKC